MITQPHVRDKHRVNKTTTVTVEKSLSLETLFWTHFVDVVSMLITKMWTKKLPRGQSHLYNRSLESDSVVQHGICKHCNVRVLKRNGWGRSGEDWWATVQSDSPQTQRQCWKTHRWGDIHVVLFVYLKFFLSLQYWLSALCVDTTEPEFPSLSVRFRHVAGAARSCPGSDAAGRGHAHRSCGESTQSPTAGTGAQVNTWSEPYTGCGFTEVLISALTEEWRRCRRTYLM